MNFLCSGATDLFSICCIWAKRPWWKIQKSGGKNKTRTHKDSKGRECEHQPAIYIEVAIRIRTLLEEESKLQQFPEGNRSVLSPLIPDPAPVTCPSVCPSMQDCENPLPRFLFSPPLHFPTWKEHRFKSIQQNLISKYHVKAFFLLSLMSIMI